MNMENFTTLIGANASGKTNAIEGIRILSEIVSGIELSVVLDGVKNTETGIRGGSRGCCRFDTNTFSLGCTVCLDEEYDLQYNIVIGVDDRVSVLEKSLYKLQESNPKAAQMIFHTKPLTSADSGDIRVGYSNGKRGPNPDVPCIRSSAILPQMKTKIPSEAKRSIDKDIYQVIYHDNMNCIEAVITSLRSILFLDPMPSKMREYWRNTDAELKPNGANLSAVLRRLCSDDKKKRQLLEIVKGLPENEITDINFIETSIGDVILSLKEKYGRVSEEVDAKRLSDGTLRCLAIVAAVLTEPEYSVIIVEEIDNGVHQGRIKGLINSLSAIGREKKIDILITTHNATLLNGLSKDNLVGVSVAYRDAENGSSRFIPFVDIADYPKLLAMGGIGDSMVNDTLLQAIKHPSVPNTDFSWLEAAE